MISFEAAQRFYIKMKRTLQKTIRHFPSAIFLVLIFISHTINENFGLINVAIIAKYLLKYLVIAILVIIFSFSFFKNMDKAAIFSAILMAIYFFFGAFHDFLNNAGFSVRYAIILSAILILVTTTAIAIKKSKRNFSQLGVYLNLTCLILLTIELITSGYNIIQKKNLVNDFGSPGKELTYKYVRCDTCSKPDIYFIVFDAYSSSRCLSSEFNHDNSALDTFLSNKGFYHAKQSRSNYAFTPLSIASTFNLNYLNTDIHSKKIDGRFIVQSATGVYESELPKILKKQGYIIRNYSLFNLKEHPVHSAEIHSQFKENIIHLQTLEGRIRRDLWGTFVDKLPWRNAEKKITEQQKIMTTHANKYIFENLKQTEAEARQTTGPPKFVYTHLSFPHDPYIFDERGNYNDFPVIYKNSTASYIKQVRYANTLIEQLVTKLLEDQTRQKIIILTSDHGYREYKSRDKLPKLFDNLSFFYFPDKDYSLLYDSISNVNTFRIVLNKHFNQQYSLLKDTSIYICDPSLTFEKRNKKNKLYEPIKKDDY
jgi:hypothetical protein